MRHRRASAARLMGAGSAKISANFGRRPTSAHLTLREAATADPMLRELVQAQAGPVLHLIALVLDEGRRTGVWDPVTDVYHFACIVSGAVVVYVPRVPWSPISPTTRSHRRN